MGADSQTVTEDGSMDGREIAAATLGVPVDATKAEIRRAFRARTKRVHPDAVGAGAGAGAGVGQVAETLMALQQARDLLLVDAPEGSEVSGAGTDPAVASEASGPRFFSGWLADPVAASRLDVVDQPRVARRGGAATRVQATTAGPVGSAATAAGRDFARVLADALAA